MPRGLLVRAPNGLPVTVCRDLWPEVRAHGATMAPQKEERSAGAVLLDLSGCRLSECVAVLPAAGYLAGRAATGGRPLWVHCPAKMAFLFERLADRVIVGTRPAGCDWGLRFDALACLQQAGWSTNDLYNPTEALCALVGCRPAVPSYTPNPDAAAVVRASLEGRRLIVVQPLAAEMAKNWPERKWPNLCQRLRDEFGALVAVSHSQPLPTDPAAMLPCPDVSLVYTSPENLAAWLAAASLVVAPDSLCLHLGAAVSAPVVGLFGPTDGKETCRWMPTATPIQAPKPVGLADLAVLDVMAVCREELGT